MWKLNISCMTAVILAGGNVCAYADPDCGDDGAQQKVIEIAKENQPNKLTIFVVNKSAQFNQKLPQTDENSPHDDIHDLSSIFSTGDACRMSLLESIPEPGSQMYRSIETNGGIEKYLEGRKFCTSLFESANSALKTTIYQLKQIRVSAIDHDTKAVTCVANLDVKIPNWGAASMSNFKFRIEQTTDGEQVVTVYGLK